MSRRLPALSFREVIRALEGLGFEIHHVTGSHYRLKHRQDPSRSTVVPRHSHDIKRGTLRAIIRQAGLTVDEFLDAQAQARAGAAPGWSACGVSRHRHQLVQDPALLRTTRRRVSHAERRTPGRLDPPPCSAAPPSATPNDLPPGQHS